MMAQLVPTTLETGGSHEARDGNIYIRHTYKLDAPPDKVLAAFQANWNAWWTMGSSTDFRVDDRQVTHWMFAPVKAMAFMIWFTIDMDPPRTEAGASGQPERIVLNLRFDGALRGPARYEILEIGRASGRERV